MVRPGRIGVGLQFGQEFCGGGAYTSVDCRILLSSKRKREFLDITGLHHESRPSLGTAAHPLPKAPDTGR